MHLIRDACIKHQCRRVAARRLFVCVGIPLEQCPDLDYCSPTTTAVLSIDSARSYSAPFLFLFQLLKLFFALLELFLFLVEDFYQIVNTLFVGIIESVRVL